MATLEQSIEQAVLHAITERIGEMIAEEETKAVERVRQRIRGETAAVAMAVFKNISFERRGLDLCILIQDQRKDVK